MAFFVCLSSFRVCVITGWHRMCHRLMALLLSMFDQVFNRPKMSYYYNSIIVDSLVNNNCTVLYVTPLCNKKRLSHPRLSYSRQEPINVIIAAYWISPIVTFSKCEVQTHSQPTCDVKLLISLTSSVPYQLSQMIQSVLCKDLLCRSQPSTWTWFVRRALSSAVSRKTKYKPNYYRKEFHFVTRPLPHNVWGQIVQ